MEDGSMDFTMDELREFLEGDALDVRADPEFKESLRRKLWEMMRARLRARGQKSPGPDRSGSS